MDHLKEHRERAEKALFDFYAQMEAGHGSGNAVVACVDVLLKAVPQNFHRFLNPIITKKLEDDKTIQRPDLDA